MLVGVISDTHGYTDPKLGDLFRHADYIIHAGDIGTPDVLDRLGKIAPILAVRGNVDRDPRLLTLPQQIMLSLAGFGVLVVHRVQDAIPDPDTRVIISGHSHRPVNEWRDRILYLNPGAAGRQGFHRERTVSLLHLEDSAAATFIALGPRSRENRAAK
ncbi:MAG TPA: metallophosphoesterase family protein [Bryobacteraceae bacterium]|nr:metallophosphoesterase family protein [Bryobacteraceae bacterium]